MTKSLDASYHEAVIADSAAICHVSDTLSLFDSIYHNCFNSAVPCPLLLCPS